MNVSRREFVKAAATAAFVAANGTPATGSSTAESDARTNVAGGSCNLIDVNVTLGRWPFRRVPLDETPALVAKLRQNGVKQAWAGTFDGIFHKDMAAANARLAEECHRHGRGLLMPFGSINPKLPDWEDDLRRCVETHQMAGIRLHPNYHGYKLDEPVFAKLLSLANERRLIIQIATDMEDERTQHPLARVPHTNCEPLPAILRALPGARVVMLNWYRAMMSLDVKRLAGSGVYFDIATLENVGGIADLIRQVSADRVVFGSHAPLFYFESALMKLKESAPAIEAARSVCWGNAQHLLKHA